MAKGSSGSDPYMTAYGGKGQSSGGGGSAGGYGGKGQSSGGGGSAGGYGGKGQLSGSAPAGGGAKGQSSGGSTSGGYGGKGQSSGGGSVSGGGAKGQSSGGGTTGGGGLKGQSAGGGGLVVAGGVKGQSSMSPISTAATSLEKLRTALHNGAGHISATNKIGVSSGVTQNGRELTAREAQWQLDRARTTSDWFGRQARTAMRRAATADNPYKAGAYTMQANAALRGQGDADDRADALGEQMAGSMLENLTRPARVAVGGGGPKGNDLNHDPEMFNRLKEINPKIVAMRDELRAKGLQKPFDDAMAIALNLISGSSTNPIGSSVRTGGGALGSMFDTVVAQRGGGIPGTPQMPVAPQITMVTPQDGGAAYPTYDYNGQMVLLGDNVDMDDMTSVTTRMNETNDLIDMINEAYA